jgi:hypothetical protein
MSFAMTTVRRIGAGAVLVLVLGSAVFWLWPRGPSEEQVRRTVVTTIEKEAPASFLVTGTLTLNVEARVDSSDYLTPDWLTGMLRHAQPGVAPLLRGSAQARVRVPGRVSYGFDVRMLSPSMIEVGPEGRVLVGVPALSVHSVSPDLAKLEVKGGTEGWMYFFPSEAREDVRRQALSGVEEAFRRQAERRIRSATQPRVNTARALEAMLTPALKTAGIGAPRIRIRVGERLVLEPEEGRAGTGS